MPAGNSCTLQTCPLTYAIIQYQPSLFGNVFYLGIFASLFLIQALQLRYWKAWSYSCCMMTGLILEVIGYYGRVLMHYNPFASNPFLMYLICVTVAPVFFTASIYLSYSRVILHYGPEKSRLTPKAISITFVVFDWIALIGQAIGGALADTASTQAGSDEGTHIMVGGLAFQVLGLLLFVCMASEYGLGVKKETSRRQAAQWAGGQGGSVWRERKIELFCYAFSAATLLILIRSIFRVAELARGFESKLANEEVPFMILEGGMMILATTVMTLAHPGMVYGERWKDAGWNLRK